MATGIEYQTLNYTASGLTYSTYLTGIAGENIVGMYVTAGDIDNGFIYDETTQTFILIGYPGAASTVPYGPSLADTASIIVVGSYKLAGEDKDNGFIYNAADGTYTTIDMPGATDTIPHSTYGEYVVGNYDDLTTANNDYAVYPSGGNAFLYDMATKNFTTIVIPDAISTTAYGIWNDVIAGGVDLTDNGVQVTDAYLLDQSTGKSYTYSYQSGAQVAVVTHFDGITGGSTAGSYIMTGDFVLADGTEGAFSAKVSNFTDIVWTDLSVPPTVPDTTTMTSGNSGYGNEAVGVYTTSSSDAINGYIATLPCFAAGSRIATPAGATAVEDLVPGMIVDSLFGGPQPVRWVGHRQVDCARHPDPASVWPVRVRAHAFGQDQPGRDLYLSPDHAIYLRDVLIPVKHLIDGDAVCQVPRDAVTYYHVQLDQHDVLTAEGLTTESFLPHAPRDAFDNGGGVTQIYPEFLHWCWDVAGCAPLVVTGPPVIAARAMLARSPQRAAA
ncbi:Hint domain-containing protein [Acidisoma cellulosilytica]|uniref:Hint domain-containing protein n=1 Tax=Acidisoma cellulosilyticum TaxID=2802395 RepID=A0A964E4Z1_9PROT|nr:Hint domain-containing protein [Acidisoma cellulosilyticum]MCB8881986.1 Hint domain-containing protein [Acidisoma cellulosilyticum]